MAELVLSRHIKDSPGLLAQSVQHGRSQPRHTTCSLSTSASAPLFLFYSIDYLSAIVVISRLMRAHCNQSGAPVMTSRKIWLVLF